MCISGILRWFVSVLMRRDSLFMVDNMCSKSKKSILLWKKIYTFATKHCKTRDLVIFLSCLNSCVNILEVLKIKV